jgi:peptide deformylase
MALLEILKYPDSRLSKVARPVSNVTDATVQLIGDMLETMYAAPGVGLAATQIGMLQRIVVLQADQSCHHSLRGKSDLGGRMFERRRFHG